MAEPKKRPPLTRSEWRKTPYATSECADPDAAIGKLLDRYGVVDVQHTQTTGPQGRRKYILRFAYKGKTYNLGFEILDAQANVAEADRVRQVKRFIYFMLKATLETTKYFVPVEQAMFAFLETETGQTVYERLLPALGAGGPMRLAGLLGPKPGDEPT